MRPLLSILLCVCFGSLAQPQRDAFNVRYVGGTVEAKISKDSWSNKLTIHSDDILIELTTGQKISIDPKRVTSLSYGRAATRHVVRWVALGVLITPIAVIGIFNESVQHYVSIEYESAEGKNSGVLIQAHKENYRNVLAALRGATGKDIEMEKKGRKQHREASKE